MGRASAVLSRRWALLAALAAALGVYYGISESLWDASTWWDVAFLSLVVIPAVFALVWFALPAFGLRWLVLLAPVLIVLAVAASAAGLGAFANFAKIAAVTAVAYVLLAFLDDLPLVVLIASVVPFVDAWSVWRGPTHVIVAHRRHLFTTFAFAFPVPGEHASANLGLPDLLFFAFFLAACVRFRPPQAQVTPCYLGLRAPRCDCSLTASAAGRRSRSDGRRSPRADAPGGRPPRAPLQ